MRLYSFDHYDQHYCLKVGLMPSVIIFYLSRGFFLPFLAAAFGSGRGGTMNYILEAEKYPLAYLACSTPALLVAVLWAKRLPTAGTTVRRLWSWGRWFLMLAAVLDFFVRFRLSSRPEQGINFAFLLMDCSVLLYLLVSPYVRDIFLDFPKADTSEKLP